MPAIHALDDRHHDLAGDVAAHDQRIDAVELRRTQELEPALVGAVDVAGVEELHPPLRQSGLAWLFNRNGSKPPVNLNAAAAIDGAGDEVDDESRQEDGDVVDDPGPVRRTVRLLKPRERIAQEDDRRGHAGDEGKDADQGDYRDAEPAPADG